MQKSFFSMQQIGSGPWHLFLADYSKWSGTMNYQLFWRMMTFILWIRSVKDITDAPWKLIEKVKHGFIENAQICFHVFLNYWSTPVEPMG